MAALSEKGKANAVPLGLLHRLLSVKEVALASGDTSPLHLVIPHHRKLF